ncbi:hypothetical protein D3C78_19780 [compost metagenome]
MESRLLLLVCITPKLEIEIVFYELADADVVNTALTDILIGMRCPGATLHIHRVYKQDNFFENMGDLMEYVALLKTTYQVHKLVASVGGQPAVVSIIETERGQFILRGMHNDFPDISVQKFEKFVDIDILYTHGLRSIQIKPELLKQIKQL